MITLIDAESGKVVKQEVDTLLDQLIVDKSTCLEYNKETIKSTNTATLYLYKTRPVTLESEQVVDSTADEFDQLCVASNKKATELIASFHRQQALEVLCKHLVEKEMIEFRKELDLTKEIIDTLQQFVAEKMPLGVDSLIQKLAKTKCLPNECNYETLLDVLNAHYPRLAEQLKNDETEIRSKLEACKQYASIQGAAVATCEERLQALQDEIGTMSNSNQKLQAVQDILEQQTSLINSYQSLKQVNISNEVDVDLNSIDIMNNEIAIGEILRANNETLDEIQENFLIQTQKTLKMNTPQQIYGHLMKWKQRIVMCRTALARNTENKSYEEAMNRVLLVACLPDDYSESAVTEVMRRKQFHSQIDKEITTFYQSISLMVDAEIKQRKRFRENMHKLPQSEISEAARKVFELIGLGEQYDELELANYSQFLLSKHHALDLLTDNVVRDNDWEEIDDFDIRNEEVAVPMSPEQPQISIPDFGLESVFFNNAIDMMKVAEEKKPVTSDQTFVGDDTSSSSTTPATPVDPITEEIKSTPSAELLELEATLATVIEENDKLKQSLADQQQQMQRIISEFQLTHETLESEIEMLSKSKKTLEEECNDTRNKLESTIALLTNEALERNKIYNEEKENLVSTVENQQEALAKSKREAEFTCNLLDETKKELQRCRLVQEENVKTLTSQLEHLSVEIKTSQLLLEEERATNISLTQTVKSLEEDINALNLLVEDHNEEKLRHVEELHEQLEQTKHQAEIESKQLKKALELAQAHSQSPSHSQSNDAELEAAQHKIKELQAIVQKSALMVNEYMTKASVVNKVRQDLAMNMTLCQRDVEQLDRRICSLREDMHEQSHLSLRGINIINQIGYMRMIIQAITDSILSSVSNVEEQTILAQHQQLIAYNNSIAEASNEVNDILLQLFQTGSESSQSFARPLDPSTVQVSLNNFQEDSKLLFFRSQKNREAFEAFNINNPGYYLSPDSVEVLKNRFGANYASTFYCVGKIIYMEPASSDVLRLNSAQPYTLVTVSFEE